MNKDKARRIAEDAAFSVEWDRTHERCNVCLGMGYKGRWRQRATLGRIWRVETCPKCQGSGSVEKRIAR